ncbi:MAG: WD40/YVTN/BNR-like repeat-containing protein [Saprospiraceae bacterium]
MRKLFFALPLIFISNFLFSQNPYPPTSGEERLADFEKRKNLLENSMIANIPFESIGPTVFSGRVVDVDVSPTDPTHFYVAYASGGLWKTINNGTTFFPIFDNEAVMTIGDIAVDWTNNIIWVGTGENNSSRSSYSGVGIYKSSDDGKTWEHKGLPESHHIGRIVLHPTDKNIAWVAALGHLYSPNKERGIYKTSDGGNTWEQTLFVNENSGGIDLIISQSDPNTIYAATWHRQRRAWDFVESGNGSGIYKSTDGGKNWGNISSAKTNFPQGFGAGRIGLALYEKAGKEILYALVDNYDRRPEEEKEEDEGITKDDLRNMSKEDFLKLKDDDVTDFLSNNRFPKKYSAKKITKMVKNEKIKPNALVEYLEDANTLLFDTPVIGAEVYKLSGGNTKWEKTHEGFLDQVYNSYGYYFGNIRVSPNDPNKIYIVGFRIIRSDDGGKTFKLIGDDNVHVDHHALWINPNRDGHIILGNDGGINISYDDGEEWIKCNSPALGQFYYLALDNAKPYNIYGGLQDNGVWVGSSEGYDVKSKGWNNSGQYHYKSIMGGDGMQVAIDLRDNNTVYTGYQYGNYFRINQKTGRRKYITPKHELGERPLRWNWQSPIHLSIHNQDILYMGSNKLFRSMNQGNNFKAISKDLTKGGKKGDVAYGTLTAIHESPLRFGLIYTGSDDGLVHLTKDGGNSWEKIQGLPKDLWITRIQASKYDEATVYIAMNGYRWDNFESHIYQSIDYGKTWKRLGLDLPKEPVNVIKEDPKNEDIIYVGTDHGLYVSFNQGEKFMMMNQDLPAVSIHDVVVHPTANDLVVATHGRSFYKTNVEHLQELDKELLSKTLHVFDIKKKSYSSRWGSKFSPWRDANEPEISIPFFTKTKGRANIVIKNKDGETLQSFSHNANQGINYAKYNLAIDDSKKSSYEKFLNKNKKDKKTKSIKFKKTDTKKTYLRPGTYTLEISKDGKTEETNFEIFKR